MMKWRKTADFQQAIGKLVNFSMFKESLEIGGIVFKAPSLIEVELICSMKHSFIIVSFHSFISRLNSDSELDI